MFNFSKLFNKKLSGRLLGEKAPYSISFINCQMDWHEIPVLKKMARKNYPTLDNLVGIPASYGQTKSDVILRVFVNSINGSLNSDDVDELLLISLEMMKHEGNAYKISKTDKVFIGESKEKALQIIGTTQHGLKPTSFSENVLVYTPSSVIIFNLMLMDENELTVDVIRSDFSKILDSIKLKK